MITNETIQIEIRRHLNLIANSTNKINQLNNLLNFKDNNKKKLLLDDYNVNSTMCVLSNDISSQVFENTCEDVIKREENELQYTNSKL